MTYLAALRFIKYPHQSQFIQITFQSSLRNFANHEEKLKRCSLLFKRISDLKFQLLAQNPQLTHQYFSAKYLP